MNTTNNNLDTALWLGNELSHGILGLCSMLLVAAILERSIFIGLRKKDDPRPLTGQARGLYSVLAWVGGIAPMAGLLGTVTGIMTSFAATTGAGFDNARLMAGIGLALIATAAGLLLAMGAFTARAIFGRRTDELVLAASKRLA